MDIEQEELVEPELDNEDDRSFRRLLLLVIVGLVLLGIIFWGVLFSLLGSDRPLRPFRGEATAVDLIIDGQPTLVTFPELSENAASFHDKRIRVTGFYLPLTLPDCSLFNGPLIKWALVSEGLQLNAKGFELPLSLVSPGTTLTVEGIWRLYHGPAGCGKEPETSSVWYLQVERIIQPNPLVSATIDPRELLLEGIVTPLFPTAVPTGLPTSPVNTVPPLPQGTMTNTPTPLSTGPAETPLPNLTLTPTSTATQTGTPSFIGTTTPAATLPPGTTATPTLTITPDGGTPGATSTPPVQPTNPDVTPYPGPGTVSPPPPTLTPTPYPSN